MISMRAILETALVVGLLAVPPGSPGESADEPTTPIWDLARLGLFDATNASYEIHDGVVAVSLAGVGPICPTGLGHLASGRESVQSIRFSFECPEAADYWLHLHWTPGGSGDERFSLLAGDELAATSQRIQATERPEALIREAFPLSLPEGAVTLTLKHLSGDGLRFDCIALSRSSRAPLATRPTLKYPTPADYEQAIEEPGIVLDGEQVMLFAPASRVREAKAVFEKLTLACEVLYELVGVHTRYRIVDYHFPDGHPDARGGTSNCVIWYSYVNLDPKAWEEWRQQDVPHVSGYIEEMAHNFVAASGVCFG